tara:strand:- start:51 stop:482 length:432 start_codon:yes stop_codon:yes gene_type:complete
MAVNLASSSPFKKDHILREMAYYFDDNRIAIVERNGTGDISGEWKSIQTSLTNDADTTQDHRLIIHYHQRYVKITNLEQDINTAIGLKYGLHLALLDYVRMRIEEDNQNQESAKYYMLRFRDRIKRYPYRKSGARGIQFYSLR